jgi:hypothetical protein
MSTPLIFMMERALPECLGCVACGTNRDRICAATPRDAMLALSRCGRLLQVTLLWYPLGVMIRMLLLFALLGFGANPAQAVPGGALRVLQKGNWVCESPGDATTPPVRRLQDSFRVIADSSYRTTTGEGGTYLLLGDELAMTGGPFDGRRYRLSGQGMLHPLDATGVPTTERCVRQISASVLDDQPDAN